MRQVNALYRIFDADDALLYVGITNNPYGRAMDHVRLRPWARRISYITFEHYDDRNELNAAEREAIAAEGPEFNVTYTRGNSGHVAIPEDEWVLEEYADPEPEVDVDRTSHQAAADVMAKLLNSGD
ncbi:MAG: GIY-YIG nuclease family protein [Mycobacterium sp.]|nr:GIY-YIG nuclease family protein [Mycobacterium sp.]